jgi:hypothetical protein
MIAAKPEPDIDELLESLDQFHRSKATRTVPEWYESVGEFLSDVRAEYR